MLKSIKIGDTLYWTTQSKKVRLIERPTEFSQIARVKCKKTDGTIVEIPAYSLPKLSKGDFYGEYFIENTISEERLKELVHKSMFYGFRVELEKKDKGYFLRIYDDSQQEVDDFISLSLEQDFGITSYI